MTIPAPELFNEFLLAARQGISLDPFLCSVPTERRAPFINELGKRRCNRGWNALHLASYFGHIDVCGVLLANGAHIDIKNTEGNTALHLACYANRESIVFLLLGVHADLTIVNTDGKSPRQMVKGGSRLVEVLLQAEKSQALSRETAFFEAVRNNNLEDLEYHLNSDHPIYVNFHDTAGNTPLHVAANHSRFEAAAFLLHNGADPDIPNRNNFTPCELTMNLDMKRLLSVKCIRNFRNVVQRFEGEVLRKQMFVYRRMWVVLSKGIISFFRRRADSIAGSKRKGYKYLKDTIVTLDQKYTNQIILTFGDQTTQVWRIYSGVNNENDRVLREKWSVALEEHITHCNGIYTTSSLPEQNADITLTSSEQQDNPWNSLNQSSQTIAIKPLASMKETLLQSYAHLKVLEAQLCELMPISADKRVPNHSTVSPTGLGKYPSSGGGTDVVGKLLGVTHSCRDMLTGLEHCISVIWQQEQYRIDQLEETQQKNKILENALRIIANYQATTSSTNILQQNSVDNALAESFKSVESSRFYPVGAGGHSQSHSHSRRHSLLAKSPEEAEEDSLSIFYDALSLRSPVPVSMRDPTASQFNAVSPDSNTGFYTPRPLSMEDHDMTTNSSIPEEINQLDLPQDFISYSEEKANEFIHNLLSGCRDTLPSETENGNSSNVWKFLSSTIGMDLSRIAMPIEFNEPLSLLQRISEFIEYMFLIEKASKCDNSAYQMALLAAFAVSSVSSSDQRVTKPFNPILGETFEFKRENMSDLRLVCEQVSHHPPVSCCHLQTNYATLTGTVDPKAKIVFLKQCMEISVVGTYRLKLLSNIDGKLSWHVIHWNNPKCLVHNLLVGRMWVEQTGDLELRNYDTNFTVSAKFHQNGTFFVEGWVRDGNMREVLYLFGRWNEHLYSIPIGSRLAYGAETLTNSLFQRMQQDAECILLWKTFPRPENSINLYKYTSFAVALNELFPENEKQLPKSDCRLRPDVRFMECGNLDEARLEKRRLEEKQRAARRDEKEEGKTWKPLWFEQSNNSHSGQLEWTFNDEYWLRSSKITPQVFPDLF